MSFCENAKEFNGQKVSAFEKDKGIEDVNIAYSFAWDWDYEQNVEIGLEVFFKDPKISEIKTIVIGNFGEADTGPEEIIKIIIDNKDKLQNVTGIFFGDITYEENECSWIQNDDLGPILKALPNLEVFKVRGGNSLSFSFLDHQKLKQLIIETGGMSDNIFEEISKADLPSLEHLELWTGSDNYGFEASAKLVASAYRGKDKKNHLPSLKYLGLRNSEITDKLVVEMEGDPILKRIETVDFSKGIFSNIAARSVLDNPDMLLLKKLDIHHNFVADELAEELKAKFGDKINLEERKALPLDVDTTDEDFDIYDYDMYIEVSE